MEIRAICEMFGKNSFIMLDHLTRYTNMSYFEACLQVAEIVARLRISLAETEETPQEVLDYLMDLHNAILDREV